MFNPYQQYQFGNEQYYPSVAGSQQYPAPAATPSFNCDMNSAYAYQQPGPSSGQYCPPPFYPPQAATAYNGSPASMPSYSPQAPSSMYPAAADSGYYGYGTFAPRFAFNGAVQSAQPPVSSSTPVAPAKSMQLYLNGRAANCSQYGRPMAASSSYQSAAKSTEALPTPESFILECLSGKKSDQRLRKEEQIENSIKSESRRKNGESSKKSKSNTSSSFVGVKKTTSFKSKLRDEIDKETFAKLKSGEYLRWWRLNYLQREQKFYDKMEKLMLDSNELIDEAEQKNSTRTTLAESYYVPKTEDSNVRVATEKCKALCEEFKHLVERGARLKATKPSFEPTSRKLNICILESDYDDDSEEVTDQSDDDERRENEIMAELKRKQEHPDRLHKELWYNELGELNDGPHCKCSRKAQKSGIRHNIYQGELAIPKCDPFSNNADRLYHYRITISPPTNFLINTPTIIMYDDHEFIFEGFSLFSHYPLERLPACRIIRFNLSYTILYVEEKMPENFTIMELDLFFKYFFHEILELVDFDLVTRNVPDPENSCSIFHFMPRFVRDLPENNGCEILSMCHVLKYLIDSNVPLIDEKILEDIENVSPSNWQTTVRGLKDVIGSIVTKPGMKPCCVRVDQLDKDSSTHPQTKYPDIIHFGIRPPQLSYAGSKKYQRLWRLYVKLKHLLANMPKPTMEDKLKLHNKEIELQKIRSQSKYQRGITVVLSSEGFYKTGMMCDIVQHALLIPVLVCHLRFHRSLNYLEEKIKYKFKNRRLLQLALTHPSYRENFGTNPDHVRNVLTNCGIRQPEYGDRRIHYWNTRKRGINTLINIMSKFGSNYEKQSNIMHNERMEFLGDAIIEFITSIHLYHLFPEIAEGGLATYRAAIVQNQHLTILATELELHQYMLFAHGSDLCHDFELRHAMANCFEAFIGALYLDGGLEIADRVFSQTFFAKKPHLFDLWKNYPKHPLQLQEPDGDRAWIPKFPFLQKLTEFEDKIGVKFKHIRLLARAFTDRSVGFTNLTFGSNQRMEFLGDTILQLICSEYLYRYFPEHHEGHLSLLRSSLVNNRTQAVVCDDLGMSNYAVYANPKELLKVKDRADLLESFLGALYIDKGLKVCEAFCEVCFFPRLRYFIMRQDWNDPKSKLQQCCLTLRSIEGREPDIPIYKVIECKGPTNGRTYTVAVYFKGKRLTVGYGHNIQQAEMNAATKALESYKDLFPHLEYQKRAITKSIHLTQRRTGKSCKPAPMYDPVRYCASTGNKAKHFYEMTKDLWNVPFDEEIPCIRTDRTKPAPKPKRTDM